MEISGRTKLCALIGDPVKHSLSPKIQNKAFQHLGLDYVYLSFKVGREDLGKAMEGVRALGIHGLNVTKPLKMGVIPFLDELHKSASEVRAVNTVLNLEGKLIGYNTDGLGALEALKEAHVPLKGSKAVILGAGGAARAVAFAIARDIEELAVLNRTLERAERLATELKERFGGKITFSGMSAEDKRREISEADLLINATSVGMRPKPDECPVTRDLLHPKLVVFDLIYDPLETRLIMEARKVGAKAINGLAMLLHQGAASFSIWTGEAAPLEVMREALREALGRNEM